MFSYVSRVYVQSHIVYSTPSSRRSLPPQRRQSSRRPQETDILLSCDQKPRQSPLTSALF
ncbi:hypothetical protein J6590_021439 [Homalodisca vitripennis]|nr:hypothetical protein J6590_021439 [Homalodisca vitripennis]